jgi:hypothetical protein
MRTKADIILSGWRLQNSPGMSWSRLADQTTLIFQYAGSRIIGSCRPAILAEPPSRIGNTRGKIAFGRIFREI